MSKMNPFDHISALSFTKEDTIVDEETEKLYNPYLTNRTLSYHADAIFFANEANRFVDLPARMQFDFYKNSLSRRKRYSKWGKPEENEQMDAVMEYFKCSRAKAIEYLRVLSPENLDMINKKNYKGEVKNDQRKRKTSR
jgi:hypothetical protein